MKLTALFTIAALATGTATFAADAAKETGFTESDPIHCQGDAELDFFGWNVAEAKSESKTRFIRHTTDANRALRQETITSDGGGLEGALIGALSGKDGLCLQTEITKKSGSD